MGARIGMGGRHRDSDLALHPRRKAACQARSGSTVGNPSYPGRKQR
jgi:hypothetical protein